MTDNQKLYSFFSMWITVCIVILCVFDPCLCVMRAVHNSAIMPPEADATKDVVQDASQDDATCQLKDVTTNSPSDMSEDVSDNSVK